MSQKKKFKLNKPYPFSLQESDAQPSVDGLRSHGIPQEPRLVGSATERLLFMSEVLEITAMSRSTLYNKLRAGEFVRPVETGLRSVRFLESEIRGWIAQRVEERDRKRGSNE